MEKYKVIALNVTGVNGKVHHAKEELTADQLGGNGRAEDLVELGFLEALKVKAKKAGDLIKEIEAAKTEAEVNEILGSDERKTVVEAAEFRIEEIKEAEEGKQD